MSLSRGLCAQIRMAVLLSVRRPGKVQALRSCAALTAPMFLEDRACHPVFLVFELIPGWAGHEHGLAGG